MRAEHYQRRLDVVTDYIYTHLDDDLSLETLAHVSGFSRYHWHRIYRAVRGETRRGYRLAVSEHRGSYLDIGRAFSRVRDRVGSGSLMVAIYEDDPDAVPPADLRSAAGTVVDPGRRIPHGLAERMVPAGRYAIMHYIGPYSSMHAAYLWLYGQWLPSSGEEPRDHPIIEEYLTDPATTPPVDAVTDILLPLL